MDALKLVAGQSQGGARIPESVSAVYAAVSAGRLTDAAEYFAADAVYLFGADPVDECAPRTATSGSDQIARAIGADLSSGRPEILVCLHDSHDCLLEGRLVDGRSTSQTATFCASLRLDEKGAITRLLSFRSRPVEPSTSWTSERDGGHDARAVIDSYLSALERSEFDAAAECFATDVLYSHPPYAPGGPRVEVRGRDALRAAFTGRGTRSWRHRILVSVQRGSESIVEGGVEGVGGSAAGTFLSSVSLAEDGLIRRYCSFYARPG